MNKKKVDEWIVVSIALLALFGLFLIFPLMESKGFDANGEGHSSGNTYIILGAESPEEASQLFWDRLWRQWQEDIYEVNPDYFRETTVTTE